MFLIRFAGPHVFILYTRKVVLKISHRFPNCEGGWDYALNLAKSSDLVFHLKLMQGQVLGEDESQVQTY